MLQYDLVVIGAGASGLVSAITALKNGVKKVILLEKEDILGGNLNLFINDGFGEFYLGKKVTGPEFASILIEEYLQLGGEYKLETKVLAIDEQKNLKYVNPIDGFNEIKANAVILASGCRERYTGNIVVPIHKYTGIFTIASAHKLVNFNGYLPGKNVVLLGSNVWTFILARRLLIEGAKIKAIVVEEQNVSKQALNIISGFNINIIYNSRIIEIGGTEKIEWVKIESESDLIDNNTIINCNSLILSIGYYPEIDYLRDIDIKRNGLFLDLNDYETSINNVFCCGTLIKGVDGILDSQEESIIVGKKVAERLILNTN